jgi:hypothetical protein
MMVASKWAAGDNKDVEMHEKVYIEWKEHVGGWGMRT